MERTKYLIFGAAAFALSIAVIICIVHLISVPLKVDETKTSNLTTIYLDGTLGPQSAGEIVAEQAGYFQRNGIHVRLRPDAHGVDLIDSVVRDCAIGVTSGQRFLLARWLGQPIVAFGASLLDTTTAIFVLQRSGLRTPKDLFGRRLSCRPGSEDAVVFDALLARLGLPRSQIRNVMVQDKFAALNRGEVDAVIGSIMEQPVIPDNDGVRLHVIRPLDYGIHIPGKVYFAGTDLVRDNSSVVQRTLQSVIAGWEDVYSDIDKNVSLIVASDPRHLTLAGVRFGLEQQRDLVRPVGMRVGDFDESRWNTLRDILLFARAGEQTESLSAGVNYEFLREAYRKPLNPEGTRGGAFGK